MKVSKRKEKVEVQTKSKGSDDEDISDLKKITALLAKAFNQKKYYAKLTNNNLRTYSASFSANKKPEYVKSVEKKKDKKDDEKKRDMSKVKYCKKEKVKDYNYYKIKMLLAKKDSDEQVLLAEDQAWMKSSTDSDQEINANMVFMAQIEKVLSDFDESSSFAEETIAEVAYYTSESKSESKYETLKYYDNSTNYGLFMNDNDDQENFHDATESASENFIENHIDSQKDYDKSEVDHNDSKEKENLIDKLIQKFNHKIAKFIQKLNKDVKRYSRKDLLSCNNSQLGETSCAYVCNDAMNVSCNSRLCDSFDENNLFIFDDESVRISPVSKMPFKKSLVILRMCVLSIVEIYLWIIDSGCSKHMTGNRALLTNFVEKFLGTVRFGNNDFELIAGYEDVGLEVAFQNSTCFVRNEDGVDLLTGDSSSNLYTIALNEVASNSSTCLLAKASSSQSCCGINIMKSSTTNVKTSNVKVPSHEEEVFHESSESFQEESSSSSLNDDVQQSSEEVGVPSSNTQSISNNMVPNVDEASTSHNVFNEHLEDAYFDSSTSFHDSSNVHTFYQPYLREKKLTKDHPLHKIISDPKLSVRTRGQLANSCLLSSIKPANVAEALRDIDWVSAMQEELDQFARLKGWRLVPRPEGKTIIKTKLIFKNKKDESSLVIRNKARLVAVGYSQQEGMNYDETFVPVARIEAICLFLAYDAHKDFTVF
nr:hypothetical protein [Tanacetum cinerariifolium]